MKAPKSTSTSENLDLEFSDVLIPFNDVLFKKINFWGRGGSGYLNGWGVEHENTLSKYKIFIWFFLPQILRCAIFDIFYNKTCNHLILDISVSRFLKMGAIRLLQMKFLRWPKI